MAGRWNALGKQLGIVAKEQGAQLVTQQAPKLIGRVRQSTMLDRALKAVSTPRKGPGVNVRPTSSAGVPSHERARRIIYSPQLDGRADPGEIVWTWVPYEDDPSQGKDRPVLVLARSAGAPEGSALLTCLYLTSPDHDRDAEDEARWGRFWMDVGTGGWDAQRRPSEIRLDRVLMIPEAEVRREGAALDRAVFDEVVAAAREYLPT